MKDVVRSFGPDFVIESGTRLLTPAVAHFYAVLMRLGVLSIDD